MNSRIWHLIAHTQKKHQAGLIEAQEMSMIMQNVDNENVHTWPTNYNPHPNPNPPDPNCL